MTNHRPEAIHGAFSGKVDTGFPQKMRPTKEARARFRFNLIETRSSRAQRRGCVAARRARPAGPASIQNNSGLPQGLAGWSAIRLSVR